MGDKKEGGGSRKYKCKCNMWGKKVKCKECRRDCPKHHRPQCGSDGVTYSNKCLLKIAKCESNGEITKASKGKCPKGDSKKGIPQSNPLQKLKVDIHARNL